MHIGGGVSSRALASSLDAGASAAGYEIGLGFIPLGEGVLPGGNLSSGQCQRVRHGDGQPCSSPPGWSTICRCPGKRLQHTCPSSLLLLHQPKIPLGRTGSQVRLSVLEVGAGAGTGPGSSKLGSVSPDRSTMTVLVPTCYEWFEEWQEEAKGKRSSNYETLKHSFVEASLSVIMRLFPQLEGKVGGQTMW